MTAPTDDGWVHAETSAANEEIAGGYLDEVADTIARLRDACLDDVVEAARQLAAALRAGGKLLICGNGGSAADAQHLAAELVGTLTLDRLRRAIPAIALTTDTSVLTAVANDFGAERVFSRQVEAHGRPGDGLIAISTSGSSVNVLAAVEEGRARGLTIVTLTGAAGGKLATMADVAIRAPSDVTGHVQEAHLAIEHLLAVLIERELHPAF
ncbi:MAG TPA: SIS domain-containing protein [Actinomycetota bacterium]|nr:SIS domain-containing protein [Actinomycetota bacterium]